MPSQTFIRREIARVREDGNHSPPVHAHDGSTGSWSTRRTGPSRSGPATSWPRGSGLATALIARLVASGPATLAVHSPLAVKAGWVSERGLFRHLIYLAEACSCSGWLAELALEHLHAHFGTNAANVAMLCRLLGGPPYSVTIHGPEEFDAPRQLGLREKIRHAAFVVAISEFTRSQLYRWADYGDWPKIHVIRVGLSAIFLEHGHRRSRTRPRLVNMGRLAEQKGQLLLVEAAARLHARGLDFELVIVGDGPMRGEIERLIDRLDLRGRVRITGFLDNQGVLRELVAARALGLPSFAEGLPGGDHGGDGPGPAGDQHVHRGHPGAGRAGRSTAGWSRPGRSSRWSRPWPRP